MTIRLLSTHRQFKPNTNVTLASGTEAALVAGGNATTDLSGGVPYDYQLPANQMQGNVAYGTDGVPLGIADSTGKIIGPFAGIAAPGAPTGLALTAIAGGVLATLTAPASNGGTGLIGYEVTLSTGQVQIGETTTITVNAPAGVAVTATAKAINGFGKSVASAASASATPTAFVTPAKPGAPTIGTLVAGNGKVTVNWTAAAANGSTMRNYLVTLSNGATAVAAGNATTIDVTTPNGIAVTATVRANNGEGAGPVSGVSNSVTPVAAAVPVAPSVTSAAAIIGTPTAGTASTATPAVFDGSPTPTVIRSWLVDGVVVATAATYTPVSGDAAKALTVREVATNTAGSATSTSAAKTISAAVTVPAGVYQVATSTFIPDIQFNDAQAGSRSPHVMKASVPTIRIVIAPWWMSANTEQNSTGNLSVDASLEYPAGTFTRILFAGVNTGVAAPGALELVSDTVAAPPIGATFWIRMRQVSAGGGVPYFRYYDSDGTAKFSVGASVPDYVMGGGEWAAKAANGQTFQAVPAAIISDSSTTPAVGIYGDSLPTGAGDLNAGDRPPYQGHAERAFAAQYPTGHVSVYGDRISQFISSHAKRVGLAKYFTHFAINFGRNDLSGGTSASLLATQTNTMIAYFPTKKVAFYTVSPQVTGTFDTVAGQTVANATVEAQRVLLNDQRRTTMPLAQCCYDLCQQVENIPSPPDGKFRVDGGPSTGDGTHYTPLAHGRIAAATDISLLVV